MKNKKLRRFYPHSGSIRALKGLFNLAQGNALGMLLAKPMCSEGAPQTHVATSEMKGDMLDRPQLAFAFCYIASHFGLDLIDATAASQILDHIADNANKLVQRIEL